MNLRDSQVAFQDAIDSGVLDEKPHSPMNAGNFMYMFSEGPIDFFKNRNDRHYVKSENPKYIGIGEDVG